MMSLSKVFDGWEGYQASLAQALAPLTRSQLVWRPADNRRSVGEIARHMSLGRITWFARMAAPGIGHVAERVPEWATDEDGARYVVENAVPAHDAEELVEWLTLSWQPVQRVLEEWTVDDLAATYEHRWEGRTYAVSRQWTTWRTMAHDIHHGGQVAMLLGIQDVDAFSLRALGGHVVMPSVAEPKPEPR